MKQIVIIGAGASGLMAAVSAAEHGAAVTLLEQNEKPGKKLNATGNGRCNLTNTQMPEDAWRGTHPEFVREAITQFSVKDTLRFFTELGLEPVSRNGYQYPRCMQAAAVTQQLLAKIRSLKVKLKTRERVCRIQKGSKNSEVRWMVQTDNWEYPCDSVVFACGSKASGIAGADGSGYLLAEQLGHRIQEPFPALCGLKLSGNRKIFSQWAGVRTDGTVSVLVDGKCVSRQRGELQLTEYGISGIPVFQVSRYAIDALQKKHTVNVILDFLPEICMEDFPDYWKKRKAQLAGICKSDCDLVRGLFPDKLVKVFAEQSLGETKKSSGEQRISAQIIKAWEFSVKEGMDFKQAQVCGGGVDTAQVDSHTMESLLHKGIFFCGELLDIDGTCGGYNLQWAWSSGFVAGKHAAL